MTSLNDRGGVPEDQKIWRPLLMMHLSSRAPQNDSKIELTSLRHPSLIFRGVFVTGLHSGFYSPSVNMASIYFTYSINPALTIFSCVTVIPVSIKTLYSPLAVTT